MIESTSSCTKASGSKPSFLMANGTISERTAAPGMSRCLASHASRRPAMPFACGMPPRPAGFSITRLLSVTANWPSRKKASRGSVATQLGLPRPALRNADCVIRDVCLASLISSSLISNGLKASNLRSVRMSVIDCSSFGGSCKDEDDHHAVDGQHGVADGVRHAVAERWDLALGRLLDHAERRGSGAHTGTSAEQDGGMELEDVAADIDREDHRDRRRHDSPEE